MSDLISRQDTIEKINERARETFTLAPGYEYYLGALHDVADDLRQMPTIDAVPVKHGKWIWMGEQGDSRHMCSVCKGKEKAPTILGEPIVWEYCPNCGAKMDGERKDDDEE